MGQWVQALGGEEEIQAALVSIMWYQVDGVLALLKAWRLHINLFCSWCLFHKPKLADVTEKPSTKGWIGLATWMKSHSADALSFPKQVGQKKEKNKMEENLMKL